MKSLILALALALSACASTTALGTSPEAQIANGAATVETTATAATVALRNHVISVNTARGLSTMLHAAGDALKDANADLVQCRKDTSSTPATSPDPCWPKVRDVVTLALDSIAGARRALGAK
jgi:hypothetical protein